MNKIIEEDCKKLTSSGIDFSKLKNKTILITGANGMIASYIVYVLYYLNQKYNFNIHLLLHGRNYDKLIKKFNNLNAKNLNIFACNIAEIRKNEFLCYRDIDYIFHCASPASNFNYPLKVFEANVSGTNSLLELAYDRKVKGFIYLSSGEAQGIIKFDNIDFYLNKEFIFEEESGYLDPDDIRSCYGECKRTGESLCKYWNYEHNIPIYIIRTEHTFGPTVDLGNDNRVFAEFVKNIVNGEDIVIKSDGLAQRTFIYLYDFANGFFRVLLNGEVGETYNIGAPFNKVSIKNLAEFLVEEYSYKNLKIIYKPKEAKKKELDKLRKSLSIKKIGKLGYHPSYLVEEGFKRTIESFEL